MHKKVLTKPTLILMYGFPGSGKTFFSRQIISDISAAHVNGDQLRYEFFENPLFNKEEDDVIEHLSLYMTEQFLQAGTSVVYDASTDRRSQRLILRDIASRAKVPTLVVWFQLDIESAFTRVATRDRRKADDKFSAPLDRTSFEAIISKMQNPNLTEDYVVVSGKHTFISQRNATYKKLLEKGLLDEAHSGKVIKPELVNLVPKQLGGRVDQTRRNIAIR